MVSEGRLKYMILDRLKIGSLSKNLKHKRQAKDRHSQQKIDDYKRQSNIGRFKNKL